MVEVIAFLFEGLIKKQIDMKLDIQKLAEELPDIGFNDSDIHYALDWLERTINTQHFDGSAINTCSSLRVYDQYEVQKLTEEARGLIYFLEQNKMITPAVRELIIDRAMTLQINYVGKEEMHWVVFFVMMNTEAHNDILAWIEKNITEIANLKTSPQKVVAA